MCGSLPPIPEPTPPDSTSRSLFVPRILDVTLHISSLKSATLGANVWLQLDFRVQVAKKVHLVPLWLQLHQDHS